IYDVPGKTPYRIANAIVANWSVSAIAAFDSGLPYTVFLASDNENIGPVPGRYTEFPNLVGDPNATTSKNVFGWFNTRAFALPPAFTRGNAGRNILRADSLASLDFSAYKRGLFLETRYFALRGAFFNLPNHTKFTTPNPLLGPP